MLQPSTHVIAGQLTSFKAYFNKNHIRCEYDSFTLRGVDYKGGNVHLYQYPDGTWHSRMMRSNPDGSFSEHFRYDITVIRADRKDISDKAQKTIADNTLSAVLDFLENNPEFVKEANKRILEIEIERNCAYIEETQKEIDELERKKANLYAENAAFLRKISEI